MGTKPKAKRPAKRKAKVVHIKQQFGILYPDGTVSTWRRRLDTESEHVETPDSILVRVTATCEVVE